MTSPFTDHARAVESQVIELLTAAGWKQRRFGCAASGSFYVGKTGTSSSEFPGVGEFIGLWCDWKLDGAIQLWPATYDSERIAAEALATVAAVDYPQLAFVTTHTGDVHTGTPPEAVLNQVPFENGPGQVRPYLVSINERYYVLGSLEVRYSSEYWEAQTYPAREVVLGACLKAIAVMRATSAPGVIVFPVDSDPMPHRCVISVALPVRDDSPAAVKERLANTFGGYKDIHNLLSLPA